MPYNGSIFDLRNSYSQIFTQSCLQPTKSSDENVRQKMYKIIYSLDLIFDVRTTDASFIEALEEYGSNSYLNIFEAECV